MSNGPMDKIKARAAENAVATIELTEARLRIDIESPIEKMLLAALRYEISFGYHQINTTHVCQDGCRFEPEKADSFIGLFDNPLIVERQVVLLDWPVDFVFSWGQYGNGPWLVVECDGHEFHERTKEQAMRDRSRDRRLQESGHTVFRFTGAEIWRDPCGCADQIIKWVINA